MSYILDALKKVEHEKTRKATAGGMTSISGDLFLERMPRPSRGGAGKRIIAIVLVVLVACAASWFVLKGEKKSRVASSGPRATTAVTSAVVAPPLPATAPVPPPQQMPVPQSPAANVAPPPVIPQPPVAVSADVGRAVKTDPKLPKPASTVPKPQIIAVQTIPAPADIKLSGIAWQEERVARRVVINGFLMQEGATVSGAKISEIHQDRVRFTSPSGIFDLRMDGATSLPGAPK